MNILARNMSLTSFDPHRNEFTCNYERNVEPSVDEEADIWFREGMAATSFDLWPDDRDFAKAASLWDKAAEKSIGKQCSTWPVSLSKARE